MTRYTPLWLQSGSYAASVDRRLLGALWPAAASSGCQVTAGTGMVVNVAPGQVAVATQNNTGTTLCPSDGTEQVTIPTAPGTGLNRIDLVICHPRGADLDGGANNDFIFDVVTGTPAATPVAPPVPGGTTALAQVYVGANVASIVAANITDRRPGGLNIAVPATPWPRENYSRGTGATSAPNPAFPTKTVSGRFSITTDTNGNATLALGPVWAEAGISPAPTQITAVLAFGLGLSVIGTFTGPFPWTDVNNVATRWFTMAGAGYAGTFNVMVVVYFQNGAT